MNDSVRAAPEGAPTHSSPAGHQYPARPWPALWALVIGFFMILVDVTIVSVANPSIKAALDPDTGNLDNVVWVTSAYLLAYAVPLLVTGRLGDRFGPRPVYLFGLAVFTLASLGCGLSTSIGMLIGMRAVQGLGAAFMTPQTMAVITRVFPPHRRGAAMGLWGATSGVAMLVGPLAGGLLVDGLGWEWIFFVNLPVGVVGFVMAWIFVPKLQTHPHRFDIGGVLLSATAMFLIVFGLQEGERYDWGVIWGPVSVWGVIAAGVIVLALFIWQQAKTRSEPLVPLALFRDRNFSASSVAITAVGFQAASAMLPVMFFMQLALGLSPTESALLLIPTAVTAGVLSPPAGRLLDRVDPRVLLIPGLALTGIALLGYALLMRPDVPTWALLLPAAVLGIGSAGMWGPLATTATRNLPLHHAGAGAGIYNATRTIGQAIGAAAMAAMLQSRLTANLGDAAGQTGGSELSHLPAAVAGPFSTAMAESILLPAAVVLGSIAAALLLRGKPGAAAKRG